MNEKEKCKKVLNVFQDYLQNTSEVEVVWSEKKQTYLFLQWYDEDNEDMKLADSAEELCGLLLNELYMDVYMEHNLQKSHLVGDWSLPPKAKEDFISRVQPYMVQLSEYENLIHELLKR